MDEIQENRRSPMLLDLQGHTERLRSTLNSIDLQEHKERIKTTISCDIHEGREKLKLGLNKGLNRLGSWLASGLQECELQPGGTLKVNFSQLTLCVLMSDM